MEAIRSDGLAGRYSAVAADGGQNTGQREGAMLFSVAEEKLNDLQFDEAFKAALEALEKFHTQEDSVGTADARRLIILIHRWQEKRREGYDMAKDLMRKYRQTDDKRGEAVMLLAVADICTCSMGSKKREEAIKAATEARAYFQKTGEKKMEALTVATLVNLHIKRYDKARDLSKRKGDCEAAAAFAAETAALFHELGDRSREAMGHHGLAAARALGDLEEDWLEPAEKALALRRELTDKRRIAFELTSIAEWHLKKEDAEKALPMALEAIKIYKDCNYVVGVAPTLQVAVRCHAANKEMEEGLQLTKDMLIYFQEQGDIEAQMIAKDLLVFLHAEGRSYQEAHEAAAETLALIRELGDKRWEANLHQTVANIHMDEEEHKKAANAILAAMSSWSSLKGKGGKREEAGLLRTAVNIHRGNENYKAALQAAQKQREIFKRMGDKMHEGLAWIDVYQVNMDMKNGKAATKACNEAAKLFRRVGDAAREALAVTWSAPAYALRGDMIKALNAAKKGLALAKECSDIDTVQLAEMYIDQITNPEKGEQQPQRQQQMDFAVASTGIASAAMLVVACAGIDYNAALGKIMDVAKASVNEDDLAIDAPLMDSGMDSLSSVAFRNQLMGDFGIHLPASLIFDAPNIRAITSEIVEKSKEAGISVIRKR